jgi:hypothetical protein
VHSVVATSAASGIPFGAFATLRAPSPAVRSRFELLQQMAAALLPGAAQGRRLIVVDDAHFLDPSSAALVHHLVTATPAFVLCTARADRSGGAGLALEGRTCDPGRDRTSGS